MWEKPVTHKTPSDWMNDEKEWREKTQVMSFAAITEWDIKSDNS